MPTITAMASTIEMPIPVMSPVVRDSSSGSGCGCGRGFRGGAMVADAARAGTLLARAGGVVGGFVRGPAVSCGAMVVASVAGICEVWAVAEVSSMLCDGVATPTGCGGRLPNRAAATAFSNSAPSEYRCSGSLRSAIPMSSRVGALIDVGRAGGAWLMCAMATDTEESPENGRLPANIS